MEKTRKFTRNLMAKFPSWMKMAKDPESIGAKFLDVFGMTFQEFESEMDYVVKNFYIGTADIDMVDILYKIPLTKDVIVDFNQEFPPQITINHNDGTSEDVKNAERIRHFYSRETILPVSLVNREDGYLYLRVNMDIIEDTAQPFNNIQIDEAKHYNVEYHHVWNAFDEFGFLLGLSRLHLENNEDFKERILDVFRNPGSNTKQGVLNGIARELGLSRDEVEVFSLDENPYREELVDADGAPSKKMREYAKSINENLKFTIDTLNIGEAYWHSIEQENIGIYFLPHLWDIDSSLFDTKEFQSGIGFDDDLKVIKPEIDETTIRDFTMNVTLVGYYENFEEFFPEVSFQYKIYAKGKLLETSYEEEEFKYTLIAAEDFDQDYSVRASQDFLHVHQKLFDNENDFKVKTGRKDSEGMDIFEVAGKDFIHFGESNDFLNRQTDNLLRLSMYLSTGNPYESNQIPKMRVTWEDTTGTEHSYDFDTREKWNHPQTNSNGQPTSTVVTSGTYYNSEENAFELGRGNFNEEIRTSADFMRGRYDTNFIVVKDGELKLNFDSINQITG